MPSKLSTNDKITLIGMCKFIISSDGFITESELENMALVAEEIGFDDYQKIFDEVDEKISSIDDLKDYIDSIKESSNRTKILKYAIQISRSDANITDEEIEIIRYAADEWGLDLNKILKS
ncbi:MAG: TerB family tellurite resistance protein [Spirochaetota bacterium]